MPKGAFIAFEGIDGSGKTTQCRMLAERLKINSVNFQMTTEPSGGPIGVMIRQFLSGRITTDERVMTALFAADRLDHLLNGHDGICGKLTNGVNILADRYYLSSIAYQSVSAPMEWVMAVNSYCAEILKPDCHIYIDMPPEAAFERIKANRKSVDIYETIDNIREVRDNYYKAFDLMKGHERIIVIDGDAHPEKVADRVWNAVSYLFLGPRAV